MHILWSGPRESDIFGLDSFICASTTIFGSNQGNNRSYSKCKGVRVDHNKPNCITDDFYNKRLEEWIHRYPDLKILYYNSIHSTFLPHKYKDRVIGCNDLSLLQILDSKREVRQLASRIIPVVPFQEVNNISQFKNYLTKESSANKKYILQENHASGGYGTHIICKNDLNSNLKFFDYTKDYLISPYYEKMISVNVHCILFDDEVVVCPGSIQIVKEINNKINYLGSDFIAYQLFLSSDIKEAVKYRSKSFCEVLRDIGYRGVLGIDFLIINQDAYLLEVNGRFQASTILLNRALHEYNLPSMQELHLCAFTKPTFQKCKEIENIQVEYSMSTYSTETWKKDISMLKKPYSEKIVAVELDGYDQEGITLNGAYLFHIIFETNLCSINPDGFLWVYENLYDTTDWFAEGILSKDPLYIKISLLNQGVKITEEAKTFVNTLGKIRNAVFSAVDITILDGMHVNCPSDVKMVSFTPWKIDISVNNKLMLYYYNYEISEVILDLADPYANRYTKSGVPFEKISFWATDRMRIHHTISCIFKKNDIGCRFCEVPKQDQLLHLNDVFEVIDFYLNKANEFRHFLIGGGSEPLDQEKDHITQIVKYIRSKSEKPIYLMCLPPKDISILHTWHEAGVTEIAFNIELFDREKAKEYMPGKGNISLSQYLSALEEAVTIWGNKGNVRTLFIAGLEKKESLLQGIESMCNRGVMPILSVFRALNHTETENIVPPSNAWLYDLYTKGESICIQHSLHLGPSCPACQNNTLSLPY